MSRESGAGVSLFARKYFHSVLSDYANLPLFRPLPSVGAFVAMVLIQDFGLLNGGLVRARPVFDLAIKMRSSPG